MRAALFQAEVLAIIMATEFVHDDVHRVIIYVDSQAAPKTISNLVDGWKLVIRNIMDKYKVIGSTIEIT